MPAILQTGPRLRRTRFAIAVVLVEALLLIVLWALPVELYARGMRMSLTFLSAVAALVLVFAWFVLWSGLARSTRVVGALLVLGVLATAAGSVRRIEFSGDMEPTVDFRWAPDRADVLEAHRRTHAASDPVGAAAIAESAFDVLEYRGAGRTGIVRGPKLARDWSAAPPKLVWRQPVGGGYASFVLVGPLLITIEQRREKEAVVAYDADTGRERWIYDYPARFSETLGGDGPRATPTVSQGKVYALGGTGVLSCLDLATGRLAWTLNIFEVNGAKNLMWGMAGSPLAISGVSGPRVVVNPGSQDGPQASRAVLAFETRTGELVWGAGQTKASYSSPMSANLGGQPQLLIFDAAGLAGLSLLGEELWRYPWTSDYEMNAAQPIVVSFDEVFISSATGAALLKIAHAGLGPVDVVWKNRNMKCSYACPIAREGFVYGLDEGILACVDLAHGERRWKKGRYGHGQILLRDDLLVVLAESGELALVEATPEAFRELGRIPAIEGKTWNNPAMSGSRIFVRNHLEMAAYELPLAEPATPQPPESTRPATNNTNGGKEDGSRKRENAK